MHHLEGINQATEVGKMLEKLSVLWRGRAAVNTGVPDYTGLAFEASKSDFSESLLPFRTHEVWQQADPAIQSTCLSYAWIIYNLKTIYIECDIVTPACEDLIKRPPTQSVNKVMLQQVMAEALLDEALHTKMSLSACHYIADRRGLAFFDFHEFNLIQWKAGIMASCTAEWQRRLTRFGIACASETLITDYLRVMSQDPSIQPICREVTRAHAMDEWSHSSVFSFAAIDVVSHLSLSEKNYLKAIISRTVSLFADNELGAWEKAFALAGLADYREIISDCAGEGQITVYSDSVEALLRRIGLD